MKPIYISQTKNAMILAIIFFIVFSTMLSGLLFVDGLANWWFLLMIVGMAIIFYVVSLYTFVRMEFYDEAILVRHLLKPRSAQEIRWEEVERITYSHSSVHPHLVSVFIARRKKPFTFSLMHESDEARATVLGAFREKGIDVIDN